MGRGATFTRVSHVAIITKAGAWSAITKAVFFSATVVFFIIERAHHFRTRLRAWMMRWRIGIWNGIMNAMCEHEIENTYEKPIFSSTIPKQYRWNVALVHTRSLRSGWILKLEDGEARRWDEWAESECTEKSMALTNMKHTRVWAETLFHLHSPQILFRRVQMACFHLYCLECDRHPSARQNKAVKRMMPRQQNLRRTVSFVTCAWKYSIHSTISVVAISSMEFWIQVIICVTEKIKNRNSTASVPKVAST